MKPSIHPLATTALATTALTLACCSPALASKPAAPAVIQVDPVSTAAGIDVPPTYLDALNQNIVLEIEKTKHFTTTADATNPASLEMKGTVTGFKAGSRGARTALMLTTYAGLAAEKMGVGETLLVTHIVLLEKDSGTVLWEGDVKGAEKGGPFTASAKVANVEAKDIAKALVKATTGQAKQKP
jgi:hypothetical protein